LFKEYNNKNTPTHLGDYLKINGFAYQNDVAICDWFKRWIRKSIIFIITKNINDQKNDNIVTCKCVDNYYSWLCHFQWISNHSKNEKKKTRKTQIITP
jgi:hypothetical protein